MGAPAIQPGCCGRWRRRYRHGHRRRRSSSGRRSPADFRAGQRLERTRPDRSCCGRRYVGSSARGHPPDVGGNDRCSARRRGESGHCPADPLSASTAGYDPWFAGDGRRDGRRTLCDAARTVDAAVRPGGRSASRSTVRADGRTHRTSADPGAGRGGEELSGADRRRRDDRQIRPPTGWRTHLQAGGARSRGQTLRSGDPPRRQHPAVHSSGPRKTGSRSRPAVKAALRPHRKDRPGLRGSNGSSLLP